MIVFCLLIGQILSMAYVYCHQNQLVGLAGGETAESFEFPFMTVINHKILFCSGAIVSEEWVLTAAHCFVISHIFNLKASDIKVIAGLVNYTEQSQFSQIRQGTEVHLHPDYRIQQVANHDLAVIRVKPFVMTVAVNIIHLSDKGFLLNEYMECTAVGWGKIDTQSKRQNTILHKLKVVSAMSVKACPGLTDWDRTTIICLQQEGGKGLCAGDSGGPLICQGELYGVAHQVYKEIRHVYERKDLARCGATGITHTYIFTCPYLNWIHHYVPTVPIMPVSCYRNQTKSHPVTDTEV